METESVRSGRSERSERSQRSSGSRPYRKHSNRGSSRDRIHNRYHVDPHGDRQTTDMDTDRDDRSVSIKLPPTHINRQHYNNQMQMALNGGSTSHAHPGHGNNHGNNGGDNGEGERIEVQILQQDDNWGETTTAITGNTSETAFSMEDMSRITKDMEDSIGFNCARYIGSILASIIGFSAFLSPIVMVVLPKIGIKEWTQKPCGPECEGLFISFTSKLLILLIGTWALFFRKPKATMPRIFIFRALILFIVFLLTFAFWLFYGVRIYDTSHDDYHSIVLYAVSLVDALLFIHYLAVILLEIRQLQPQYVIKMTRSPDGETKHYTAGQLSIQRLAVWCLEQYYKDFNVYNPYLEHMSRRTPKLSGFKFYDVDGVSSATPATRSRAIFAAAARRRDTSHNDRFYEEQDYERRIRKRRARLITAAEEAFTHVKRLHDEQGELILTNLVFYLLVSQCGGGGVGVSGFTLMVHLFKNEENFQEEKGTIILLLS